ncbi:thioredoxin domain-containing protein [Lewinella sp. W8]|uniref:thioredoxin domain-containing protein n=1 Tax=Lewinella sp. W8 TaxID=2528208 RepID=UPI00106843EC|nr:thioredoxin domain-containing protein [Lewinella sp. W8]MTB51886.1 DUF255 domain-containing protein [Lewinella sp. W8]
MLCKESSTFPFNLNITAIAQPAHTNALIHESSPYLLQHAHNPVDWHPWKPEVLAEAQRLDRPIIVSIGYSTCHWCHVMERESFEDEETAALMNEKFICIKVDREERPDVDRVYMEACQAISGGGGWPLNAFLLPDGRPFYAGTYYPPERKYNRPSWRELLEHLSNLFEQDRKTVEEQADRLTDNIRGGGNRLMSLEPQTEDHDSWREALMTKLRGQYDLKHGGFGGAPKFPMSQSLEALLVHGMQREEYNDLHLAAHGMLAMLDGGIYDHLGGGFSRYTVDAQWRVPHFEKMLYDNALLLRLLAKLQMAVPNARFVTAMEETTEWLLREMLLPAGGYRAALDADSEGVEGKYYVWQLDEVADLIPEEDLPLVAAFYGLTETGNWEEEHTNIPYRPDTLAAAAAAAEVPLEEATERIASARKILHTHRVERVPPGADDKMILQWNALLISGWCWCYRATQEKNYLRLAEELWYGVKKKLYVDGQWYRNRTNGQLGAPAFLDDYAALAEALLELSAVNFDLSLILGAEEVADKDGPGTAGAGTSARSMVDYVLSRFSTPRGPMFFLQATQDNELPVDTLELFDNALPSGNSQMCSNLLRLHRITGEGQYLKRGEEMLAAMAGGMERYPSSFGGWVQTALVHAGADEELVVTGREARAAAREFLSLYRPGMLIVATETEREDVPVLKDRYLDGELRYYFCQNQQCLLPVTTAEAARAQILNS